MLVIAHLLWTRGTPTRLGVRLRDGLVRLRGAPGAIAGVSLGVAMLTGSWIYYNTDVLNAYRTQSDEDALATAYERKFIRFENLPQPSVTDVRLNVDLYPGQARAVTRGVLVLRNLTDRPIRDIHVRRASRFTKLTDVRLAGSRPAVTDALHGYRILRLDGPIAPGETRELVFATLRQSRGFACRAATPDWWATAPSSMMPILRPPSA